MSLLPAYSEEEAKAIQSKDNLTLKEAALLLNISPLTLRRWILAGKINSNKVGKKHLIYDQVCRCIFRHVDPPIIDPLFRDDGPPLIRTFSQG